MSLGAIAHYNLLEQLEPDGPGDLYRARDTRHGRTVAVRLLPADFTADEAARAAFIKGARSLASLSHPNAIALFDAGEHDGRAYLVFEFLKGQSLRAEMAGRSMNVRRAVEIAIQAADAVAYAHAAGFAHRGLSPDSVVITGTGHAKIPAFEFATRTGFDLVEGQARLRDYESPEEARGEAPDDRCDVYSVGAMLYEMLTTKRPHPRGAAAPRSTNPHVPEDLDALVLKAVAPNPELRVQSAAALAAELRRMAVVIEASGAADDEPVERMVQEPTRTSRALMLALVVVAIVAAAAWWMLGR